MPPKFLAKSQSSQRNPSRSWRLWKRRLGDYQTSLQLRRLAGIVSPFGLPQLDGIALGVVQAGEAAVRIVLLINVNWDARGAQLRHHRIEAVDTKIDHPNFAGIAEVRGRLGERCKRSWSGFLPPGQFIIVRRSKCNA